MNKIFGIITIIIITLSCGCAKNDLAATSNNIGYNDIETIPCIYDVAFAFLDGHAIVKEGNNYKIIDKVGNTTMDMPEYDNIGNSLGDLISVEKEGKWGYINREGEEVIPCSYDNVSFFSEGMAGVNKDGKWGYINQEGKEVIPCSYDNVSFFSEGMAGVNKDGKWGYINQEGEEVISCSYDNGIANDFENGVARVKRNKKWGCVDKSGKEIVPCIYDYIDSFSEGLARVTKYMEVQEYDAYLETYNSTQKLQYGYINLTGEEVIPCGYDYAWEFSEGLAWVEKENKLGCIDITGKEIIPCIYQNRFGIVPSFAEGLSLAAKTGKVGYIDATGNVIIDFIYDGASDFSDGLARVKKNGKYGFIDRTGKEIIPCIYSAEVEENMDIVRDSINGKRKTTDDVKIGYYFSKGICTLVKNGKYGYIDKSGKEVIPCIYDEVLGYSEGFVRVKRNGKWGYIKLDEDIIK